MRVPFPHRRRRPEMLTPEEDPAEEAQAAEADRQNQTQDASARRSPRFLDPQAAPEGPPSIQSEPEDGDPV